jgi:putative transposase
MNRVKPANDEVYHIYNRGVEKRNIFGSDRDRFRFIHDLYEFNDRMPAANSYYCQPSEVGLRKDRKRELLVEILAFCLMPNHFHLMLKQVSDDGITEFMRKLGTGYVNYFNIKNKRVGPLFQGKYKAALIQKESYYIILPHYIHLNPLKIIMPNWKEGSIKDLKKAINFLENYRWSSFQDYIGKKNFPSIIDRSFVSEFYGGAKEYKKNIKNALKNLPKSDFGRF